ncbi:MAG: Nif3-like dinuclear metal center hexameric protein [Ruminococcaceae bacterium]|nr:Nif3-like dinuclear metal center hexameric protein [Oscillospiraceae bacterium]
MDIKRITDYFDEIAPSSRSAEWDNDGIMLMCAKDIQRVVVTLDVTTEAVKCALENGAQLIISHHPIIFHPIKSICDDYVSENIKRLIKSDISVLSYHTRMDASDVGINQYILNRLGLGSITPFGLFNGDMTGRIGSFVMPLSFEEVCQRIKHLFRCDNFTYTATDKMIKSIAVVSGGGSEYMDSAADHGADLYISGEFKHHHYLKAQEIGFPLIGIDHFHCENVFTDLVCEILKEKFNELDIIKNTSKPPFNTMN